MRKLKFHEWNMLFAIFLYVLYIILDWFWLRFYHDDEISKIKEMRSKFYGWRHLFNFATTLLLDPNLGLVFLYFFYGANKKNALIIFTVAGMESVWKKFLASVYAEPRPFFFIDIGTCFCIYGNPSGHVSGYIVVYYSFFYFLIYR